MSPLTSLLLSLVNVTQLPQVQYSHLTCLTMMYLQRCWRLWTLLNLETGWSSWTRIGPKTCANGKLRHILMFGHMICVSLQTGLRCKKNRYLPDLECFTAFSMKSTIVLLLNFVKLPKLKLPVRKYALVKLDTNYFVQRQQNTDVIQFQNSYPGRVLFWHGEQTRWVWRWGCKKHIEIFTGVKTLLS